MSAPLIKIFLISKSIGAAATAGAVVCATFCWVCFFTSCVVAGASESKFVAAPRCSNNNHRPSIPAWLILTLRSKISGHKSYESTKRLILSAVPLENLGSSLMVKLCSSSPVKTEKLTFSSVILRLTCFCATSTK
jgi:hypothetical protein